MRHALLRSAFSVLSVTLGIASAVVSLGLAQGTYVVAGQAMGRMGADRISVSDPTVLMAPSGFSVDDARAMENELANVNNAFPARHRSATVSRDGRNVEDVGVHAEGTSALPHFMYEAYELDRGTYLTEADNTNGKLVAVIGAGLHKRLYPAGDDPLGDAILIDGVPFTVKGVLAPHRIMAGPLYTPERADQMETFVYVPFGPAAGLFPTNAGISIRAFLVDPSRAEETARDIVDLLFRRHGRSDFGLLVHAERVRAYWDMIALESAVLVGVAAIALAARPRRLRRRRPDPGRGPRRPGHPPAASSTSDRSSKNNSAGARPAPSADAGGCSGRTRNRSAAGRGVRRRSPPGRPPRTSANATAARRTGCPSSGPCRPC